MYSRDTLAKYLDIALNAEATNGMIVELMGELEQIPVDVEMDGMTGQEARDEVNKNLTEYLPDMLQEDEIYSTNPNYKTEAKDFSVYDSNGKLLLKIAPDKTIEGHGALTFTVPFTNPDDKEAFLDFCDRLQRNSAVKYPYTPE